MIVFIYPVDPEKDFVKRVIGLPGDSYFVLGDNRDHSYDSRFWGAVPAANVRSRALFVYWSWDADALRVRFERIGRFVR